MALKAQLFHRKSQLEFKVGGVGGMTAKAVIFLDRRMNTFLAGLIIMAFVTDLGTLILDRIQSVIALMIAAGGIVTGGALPAGQTAMHKGSGYLAGMALVTGFSADTVNGSGFSR
jgi:hypothetical protein